MSSKSKKKKSVPAMSISRDDKFFSNYEVKYLDPKNVFEVIAFVGKNEASNNSLKNFIPISKKFEEVSNAAIITYEEALDLLDSFEPASIPESIENELKFILSDFKIFLDHGGTVGPHMSAKLLKIKLIDSICKRMCADRERILRIKAFDEELNLLMKECRTRDNKHEKHKRSNSKINLVGGSTPKKGMSRATIAEEQRKSKSKVDVMETESIEDIVFDDDLSKHIQFYIFQGITDVEVIKHLNESLNLPITAIVQVQLHSDEEHETESEYLTAFWNQTFDYLYDGNRQESFENTILMKYNNTSNLNYQQVYQELIDMLTHIWDAKLRHLHFIRHTNIVPIKGTYHVLSVDCLSNYKNYLQPLPNELINERVLLSSLLREVSFHNDIRSSTKSLMEDENDEINGNEVFENSENCPNPLLLTNIIRKGSKSSRSVVPQMPFVDTHLIHDSDLLHIIRDSYQKNVGSIVLNLSFDILKRMQTFYQTYAYTAIDGDLLHKHDKDPSSVTQTKDVEKMYHFMYIFLFGLFTQKNNIPIDFDTKYSEAFEEHSQYASWQRSQINVVPSSNSRLSQTDNLYKIPLASYLWKEQLSSDVLIQEVGIAEEDYQYVEVKYCPETGKYLAQFSDNLDEFGVNVRVFEEQLPTAVCLRDFCKYLTKLKAEWLSRNQPPKYYRKDELFECPGLRYQNTEYKHLLSSKSGTTNSTKEENSMKEEQTVSFDEILKELKYYPLNKSLFKESAKFVNVDTINVFDVGTSFISVSGAITTFASHDGVKLIVDNSRFTHEKFKCTARLSCGKYEIVVYSDPFFLKNNYDFHVNLKDGTIITFFMNDYIVTPVHHSSLGTEMESTRHSSLGTDEESIDSTSNLKTNLNQVVANLKKAFILPTIQDSSIRKFSLPPKDTVSDLDLDAVIKSLNDVEPTDFFKINNSIGLISPTERNGVKIPLKNLIDQIIRPNNTTPKTNQQTYSKRLVSTSKKRSKHKEPQLDFRLSLPNGLYLTCVPSVEQGEDVVDVKQEFLEADKSGVFEEEFRLFCRKGFVLVKRIDGTIIVFKTYGDQICFEKLDSDHPDVLNSSLKTCHCKNMDDYKKKLAHIMNKRQGEDVHTASRRGNVRTKKGYVIDENVLDMVKNFKIPYKRTSVLKFSGHKTCLEGNRVTQKHVYVTTCEHDFSSEQIYFERPDGFRSLFDRDGKLLVEFSDGTIITSCVHVKKDLVDGYVYISMNVRFEHPKYVTVDYDVDKTLNIELNNMVKLTRSQDNTYVLKHDSDIETEINTKGMSFRKTCDKCKMQYKCDFNMEPLFSKNIIPSDNFVHIEDSYEKTFSVDFAGNCERLENFVHSPLNSAGCNHFRDNVYKKLFIFDEQLIGQQFWSESMVEKEKNKKKSEVKIKETVSVRGTKLLRFIWNHQDNFSRRYCNNSLKIKVSLPNHKHTSDTRSKYYTYRVLQKMIDREEIEKTLADLGLFFADKSETSMWDSLHPVVDSILKGCQALESISSSEKSLDESVQVDENGNCKCIVIRKTMQEKISTWREELNKYREMIRNPKIPNYFESEFCQIIAD